MKQERRFPPLLLAVIGGAVAARLAAVAYVGSSVEPLPGIYDQVSYHALALRVASHHGFSFGTGWWPATPANEPTAHWSFLYVLFLAAIYALAGSAPLIARVIQAAAVGVLQPWLAFRIGNRLFGEKVGLVYGALVAGYTYFIYYSVGLLTESFYIVAVLWIVDTATRMAAESDRTATAPRLSLWVQFGGAMAAAVLLRQVLLLLLPIVLIWIGWRLIQSKVLPAQSIRVGVGVSLAGLVLLSSILPWTLRNYRVFHQVVLLNTNAGFAFFWGNHPIHGTAFQPLLVGDGTTYGKLIPRELLTLNEGALDRALLRRGLGFVAADPGRFVRLSLSRSWEYFKFWPTQESGRLSNLSRLLSFGLCLPFMIAGASVLVVGSCRGTEQQRPRPDPGVWLLLAMAATYSAIHVATWTLVRYRLPVDALMLPFAAVALVRLFDRIRIMYSSVRPSVRLVNEASS